MSTPVGNSAANASGNGPASGYSLKLWLFILFMFICVISINMFTCFILLLKVIEILLVYIFNFGIKLCPKLPKFLTVISSSRVFFLIERTCINHENTVQRPTRVQVHSGKEQRKALPPDF